MIKVECSTTNYAVCMAVSDLFARLAENSEKGLAICEKLEKVTLDGETFDVSKDLQPGISTTVEAAAAPPAATEPAAAAPPAPGSEAITEEEEYAEHAADQAGRPGVDLDGTGLPWDDRINVATKTLRQSDNTWKLKRNLEPALVESVLAELRATMGAAAAPPVTTTETAAAAATPSATAAAAPPVTATTEVAAGTPTTFPGLLQAFTYRQGLGKVTTEEMDAICIAEGLPSLAMIVSRPDLIPTVFANMEALCLTRA